jgi:hypothetical protein
MLGDNIYGTHTPEDYRLKFEEPYRALLDAGVTFHAALSARSRTAGATRETGAAGAAAASAGVAGWRHAAPPISAATTRTRSTTPGSDTTTSDPAAGKGRSRRRNSPTRYKTTAANAR